MRDTVTLEVGDVVITPTFTVVVHRDDCVLYNLRGQVETYRKGGIEVWLEEYATDGRWCTF